MSYQQASADITASGRVSNNAKVSFANDDLYTPFAKVITYLSIRAATNRTVADALKAYIAVQDADVHASLNGPGLDVNNADFVAVLTAANAVTPTPVVNNNQMKAIQDVGRVPAGKRYASWGLASFDANTLTRLPDCVAWEVMSQSVDLWLGYLLNNEDARPIAAVMLGITDAALKAKRDAMVAAVQSWKTKAESGQGVAGMPTTAAALWATL